MSSTNGLAIGIDLGISNVRAAVYKDNNVKIIPGQNGRNKIPACVSYSYGSYTKVFTNLVGSDAQAAMKNGQQGIYKTQQLIGRHSSEIHRLISSLPFGILLEDPLKVKWVLSHWANDPKQFFYLDEILGKIIKHLKDLAEGYLKESALKVVLTVPASFNEFQRQTVKNAGMLAGFENVEVITQATAALVAHFHKFPSLTESIFVFDLGTSSLNLTILKVERHDVTVHASEEYFDFGGDQFTTIIQTHVLQKFKEQRGYEFDQNCIEGLFQECETKKKELSIPSCQSVVIKFTGYIRGSVVFTKEEYRALIQSTIDRCFHKVGKFFSERNFDTNQIDRVILVGGATRLPEFTENLKKIFPSAEVTTDVNDETIVEGAAIYASNPKIKESQHIQMEGDAVTKIPVFGICTAAAIGVKFDYDWQIKENQNSNFGILISKGTQVPYSCKKRFWFLVTEQRMELKIYEGDDTRANNNELLGSFPVLELGDVQYCMLKLRVYLSAGGELKIKPFLVGWTGKYDKQEFTVDIFKQRKVHPFHVYRLNERSQAKLSRNKFKTLVDETDNDKAIDFDINSAQFSPIKVHYQEQLEPMVSSATFIPVEELEKGHATAVKIVLEQFVKFFPLTSELINMIKQSLDALFEKYLELNEKKKSETLSKYPIGIDLGTTNCCVAFITENGMEIVPSPIGKNFIASYVALDENDLIFGDTAKMKAFQNPETTIFDIKRMLGRHIENPQVKRFRRYWSFKIENNGGSISVCSRGKKYRPEELVTMLLKHLKEITETFLNQDVVNVVVTIPSYFTEGQKHLTKEACHNAGLNAIKLLSEPQAAALAYYNNIRGTGASEKNCLIFDLGGGTLDVAVLEVKSNQVHIKVVDGDAFLGGGDLDNALMDHCIEAFEKQHNILIRDADNYAAKLRRLKDRCESVKENLSFALRDTLSLDAFYGDKDLAIKITRDKLESLIQVHLDRCMEVVDRVVAEMDGEISEVVLVGGSSRIPRLQNLLTEKFGPKVIKVKSLNPDEAVARGAALYAAMILNPTDTDVIIAELKNRVLV